MRCLIAVLAVVGALAAPAGAAAATLTLTNAPGPAPGSTIAARATGTLAGDSLLIAFLERDGVDCASNAADHRIRFTTVPVSTELGTDPPPAQLSAGPFDVVIRWAPFPAGTYRLCAYIYGAMQEQNQVPLATATTVLTMVDDNDSDGVPDASDACPDEPGTGPDGCPPAAAVPAAPTLPAALPAPRLPVAAPAPPAVSDPTGVMKLKTAKGKATACGAGCLARTRTVGPFSFALKVKVAAGRTTATGTVTLTRRSAQAGTTGKVCLDRFAGTSFKQKCQKVTWKAGGATTLTGSITTPTATSRSVRPGFRLSAQVGALPVGDGDAIYLKKSGKRVVPDTNESACVASAHARAAC